MPSPYGPAAADLVGIPRQASGLTDGNTNNGRREALPSISPALAKLQLLSLRTELRCQFEQPHSREDFLGLIRESQTLSGAMSIFLRRWHGDAPIRKRRRQLGGSNRQFVTRVPRSQKKPRQVLALVDRVPTESVSIFIEDWGTFVVGCARSRRELRFMDSKVGMSAAALKLELESSAR